MSKNQQIHSISHCELIAKNSKFSNQVQMPTYSIISSPLNPNRDFPMILDKKVICLNQKLKLSNVLKQNQCSNEQILCKQTTMYLSY